MDNPCLDIPDPGQIEYKYYFCAYLANVCPSSFGHGNGWLRSAKKLSPIAAKEKLAQLNNLPSAHKVTLLSMWEITKQEYDEAQESKNEG